MFGILNFHQLNCRADAVKYYATVYVDPLLRIATFCVGIFLGWLLYETKKTTYRLNKVSFLIYVISFLSNLCNWR